MIIRHLRNLIDSNQITYKIVEEVYGKDNYFILSYNNKKLKIKRTDLETAIREKRLKVAP